MCESSLSRALTAALQSTSSNSCIIAGKSMRFQRLSTEGRERPEGRQSNSEQSAPRRQHQYTEIQASMVGVELIVFMIAG